MAVNYTSPRFSAEDDNGRPLIGGRLFTYQNGTTTPSPTYQDAAGTILNTNPIILNARGEAVVHLSEGQVYTFVLQTRTGVLVWSQNSIVGAISTTSFTEFLQNLLNGSGANLVGFKQPWTGSIARSVQQKLEEISTIEDAGVTQGMADATQAIQTALDSGQKYIRAAKGGQYIITSITLPDDIVFDLNGGTLLAFGSNETDGEGDPIIKPAMVKLGNRSILKNGTIDGKNLTMDAGVEAVSKSKPIASDLNITRIAGALPAGRGTSFSRCTEEFQDRCIVTNVTGQGIYTEYSDGGLISECRIDKAYHGVQFWGGDSATESTKGVTNLRIVSCYATKVLGGVWGSCGDGVSVTNCVVEDLDDVGIDFEGCSNSTMSGNTSREAKNGCYALFFGCTNCTISGNTGINQTSVGAGIYIDANDNFPNWKNAITGNTIQVRFFGIRNTAHAYRGLQKSTISGNVVTAEDYGIWLDETQEVNVSNNFVQILNGSTGINLLGSRFCMVADNTLNCAVDPPRPNPLDVGGIVMNRKGSAFAASNNTVANNWVSGFTYAINDNGFGNVTQSFNWIKDNRVSTSIYKYGGDFYSGRIERNYPTGSLATEALTVDYYT